MWLIAGTIPEKDFSLYPEAIWKPCQISGDRLILPDGRPLPIARGTTALAATGILASRALGIEPPGLLLAGDCGTGDGSRELYGWLTEHVTQLVSLHRLRGITFHYFYPDIDHHNQLYLQMEELKDSKPILVADAGFMYVAKMSGYASCYDLFTPDVGELAFLADEKAPHPFYTRGFLLANEEDMPGLLKRAMEHDNCPANMIVKGKTDYIVCNGEIVASVAEPSVEAMECIGGTGDIVTGLATAYLAAGYPICKSALYAARASRSLALLCNPDPATQVSALISKIEPMLCRYCGL